MTFSAAAVKAWLNNPASGASVYRRNFNQLCVALVYHTVAHFGTDPGRSYASANDARRAATIHSTDMNHAPIGAIGYYSGGSYGDIAVSLGDGKWLHASSHFTAAEMLAPNSHVGILTDAQYRARSGYKAVGWSYRFGGTNGKISSPATSTASVGTPTPATPPKPSAPPVIIAPAPTGKPVELPAPAPTPAPAPAPEPTPETPVTDPTPIDTAPAITQAQIDEATAALEADRDSLAATIDPTALSGLLNGHPAARKRAYYLYASAALIISFGPDLVVSGVITGTEVPHFATIVGLATSVLLKIGVAFGFVAASNTAK